MTILALHEPADVTGSGQSQVDVAQWWKGHHTREGSQEDGDNLSPLYVCDVHV